MEKLECIINNNVRNAGNNGLNYDNDNGLNIKLTLHTVTR